MKSEGEVGGKKLCLIPFPFLGGQGKTKNRKAHHRWPGGAHTRRKAGRHRAVDGAGGEEINNRYLPFSI